MIKQWFRLWDFLSFTLYLRSDKWSFLAPMDSSSVSWAIHNFSKVHNLIACFDTSYYRPSLSDQDVLVTLEIVLLPRFESNLQHAPSSSSNLDSSLRFYDQSSKSNWASVSFLSRRKVQQRRRIQHRARNKLCNLNMSATHTPLNCVVGY